MDFDDMLKDAWQAQAVPAAQALLHRRVQRQRWRHRLLRALEVALTVVAVLVFGQALATGRLSWTDAITARRVQASGIHSDLSELWPLAELR